VNENRIAPRKRVLKGAFIITSEKAPKLACTVKNISDTGAALQVSTTFGLPAAFDLIFDNQRFHCRSMWRTDTKIGVKFETTGGV
jgi:hypothetical protein